MKLDTIDQYENFKLKKIEHEPATIAARNDNYNELYIFIKLNNKMDYAAYRKLCILLNIIPKNEIDFKKWFKESNKKLNTKLVNYSNNNNLEIEFVKNKLKKDDNFIRIFVTDPKKQTFNQHYAAKHIKNNIPFIVDFEELPSDGDNAMYVVNGQPCLGKEVAKIKTTKSIDFRWYYKFKEKELTFYATHKYTEGSGGAQDNQFKDVEEFLKQARDCTNPDVVFLSITDGSHYQMKVKNEKNKTKLKYLKSKYKGDRVVSTTTNTLLMDILPFIEKWLKENFTEEEYSDELIKINIIKNAINLPKPKKIKGVK